MSLLLLNVTHAEKTETAQPQSPVWAYTNILLIFIFIFTPLSLSFVLLTHLQLEFQLLQNSTSFFLALPSQQEMLKEMVSFAPFI